jgi:hypothetical protein
MTIAYLAVLSRTEPVGLAGSGYVYGFHKDC